MPHLGDLLHRPLPQLVFTQIVHVFELHDRVAGEFEHEAFFEGEGVFRAVQDHSELGKGTKGKVQGSRVGHRRSRPMAHLADVERDVDSFLGHRLHLPNATRDRYSARTADREDEGLVRSAYRRRVGVRKRHGR